MTSSFNPLIIASSIQRVEKRVKQVRDDSRGFNPLIIASSIQSSRGLK